MKVGDKVRVVNYMYGFNGSKYKDCDFRERDWPIGSVGTIVTADGWDEAGDGKGVSIVDKEGNNQWGFHVDELELISVKNYIEFHDADRMKLSFPRNSFFVTERQDGGATIHLLDRMIFWQVKESYEEAMRKVEE